DATTTSAAAPAVTALFLTPFVYWITAAAATMASTTAIATTRPRDLMLPLSFRLLPGAGCQCPITEQDVVESEALAGRADGTGSGGEPPPHRDEADGVGVGGSDAAVPRRAVRRPAEGDLLDGARQVVPREDLRLHVVRVVVGARAGRQPRAHRAPDVRGRGRTDLEGDLEVAIEGDVVDDGRGPAVRGGEGREVDRCARDQARWEGIVRARPAL